MERRRGLEEQPGKAGGPRVDCVKLENDLREAQGRGVLTLGAELQESGRGPTEARPD